MRDSAVHVAHGLTAAGPTRLPARDHWAVDCAVLLIVADALRELAEEPGESERIDELDELLLLLA